MLYFLPFLQSLYNSDPYISTNEKVINPDYWSEKCTFQNALRSQAEGSLPGQVFQWEQHSELECKLWAVFTPL